MRVMMMMVIIIEGEKCFLNQGGNGIRMTIRQVWRTSKAGKKREIFGRWLNEVNNSSQFNRSATQMNRRREGQRFPVGAPNYEAMNERIKRAAIGIP